MSEMLAYMDSKPFNKYVVIFDDLKRLARDTEQYIRLKKALELRHAVAECPNFTFNASPEGQYVETIMAATAQLEREQNRRQVLQKMKARLELGYWCFPDVPEGYEFRKDQAHGKLPFIVSERAVIVKEALEGFASGRFMEQDDVRRFLQEKDIRNGRPVYLQYVKRMLTRVFYAGYIVYEPWEVSIRQSKHEALIDLATYERIQERLSGKTTTHTKKVLNEDFPLRSFVLCSDCRKPVTASWSSGRNGKFPYYRCKMKGCVAHNKSIRKAEIEKQFEDILEKINPNEKVLNLTKAIITEVWRKKEDGMVSKRKDTEREIEVVQEDRLKFAKLVSKATDDGVIATYEERIGALAKKELVLKNSLMSFDLHRPNIETALDIVFDFLKDPLKQWKTGGIHTQKLVLKLVFEQNLAYNKKSGFETAHLSLPLRVFTLPEASKLSVVEMGGFESQVSRCCARLRPRLSHLRDLRLFSSANSSTAKMKTAHSSDFILAVEMGGFEPPCR